MVLEKIICNEEDEYCIADDLPNAHRQHRGELVWKIDKEGSGDYSEVE